MHTNQLIMLGCGGHGKVVFDALSLSDLSMSLLLCDDNPDLKGKEFAGLFIQSSEELFGNYAGHVHIALGNNKTRQSLYERLASTCLLFTVTHPKALISKSAQVQPGSFIAAGAILGPESRVGEGCIINHGAVVDHEVHIGAYSHIAPNSTLGGAVTIGKGVLVGAGAVILPGISVGDGAIIAAGAVVTKPVSAHALVKGIPAV